MAAGRALPDGAPARGVAVCAAGLPRGGRCDVQHTRIAPKIEHVFGCGSPCERTPARRAAVTRGDRPFGLYAARMGTHRGGPDPAPARHTAAARTGPLCHQRRRAHHAAGYQGNHQCVPHHLSA
ncbi:hypothetical protein GCM10023405_23180 [Streptomonospora salina]